MSNQPYEFNKKEDLLQNSLFLLLKRAKERDEAKALAKQNQTNFLTKVKKFFRIS